MRRQIGKCCRQPLWKLACKILPVILLVPVACGLSGCGKSYTYHYRLTLTVRDKNRTYQGTSVVRVLEQPTLEHGASVPRLCGEAAIVDLGQGRLLIGLLEGRPGYFDPKHIVPTWGGSPTNVFLARLGLPVDWTGLDDSGLKRLPGIKTPVALGADEMPDLVTFRNSNDPTTIEQVDSQNLAATFGPGVQLVSAVIQVTDEGSMRGELKKYLPWFDSGKDFLDGNRWRPNSGQYSSYKFARCSYFTSYLW